MLQTLWSASAQPAQPDFAELEKVIVEELKERNTPGAAVAVVSGDRVIYAKGFGVASVETAAPVTPEMLFRLGSTTKMFTAAALVTLAEQGRLKLDAPIGDYVKGLSPRLAGVTVHQLLSNTSGLRDSIEPPVSHDEAALARMVRAWKEDAFYTEPGKIYSYSSPGFWLAGVVIEEVAGKPYAEAMQDLLFAPLGMGRTTLRPLAAVTHPFALGHSAQGKEQPAVLRPIYNNAAIWPAGSIFSSVTDLSRFVIALLDAGRVDGRQALAPALSAKLSTPHAPIPGETEAHYAYGLMTFNHRGVRLVMHGGFSRGYGSMIQMAPAHRFAVIVVTNKSGETLPRTVGKALELGLPLKAQAAEPARPALPVGEAEAADYVGLYAHPPQTWEVFVREGRLFLKQGDQEFALKKVGDLRFAYGPAGEREFVLVRGADGRVEHLFSNLYSARKVRAGK